MRQPPLGALKTFRAAAHTLSFTRAAAELNVTQAAVSHQIKALEEALETSLFERGNRSLALTEAGNRLLPYVDQMFQVLEQGLRQIRPRGGNDTLTVSLLPSFATRWMVSEVALHRQRAGHGGSLLGQAKSFLNARIGRFGMYLTRHETEAARP